MITVLFFGPVAERAGQRRLEVEHRFGMRLQDLRDSLQARFPEAFALVTVVAVDGEQLRDPAMLLADRSEVVFMSKFSGG